MNFTICFYVSISKILGKITRYYVRNCNTYKFQKLMSTPKVKLLNNISEFVHIVLSKFNQAHLKQYLLVTDSCAYIILVRLCIYCTD